MRWSRLVGSIERQIRKRNAPGRLGIFLGLLACLWLPIALPLYFFRQDLAAILLLYSLFLMLLRAKGRLIYGDRHPLERWGLVVSRQSGAEAIAGFFLAAGSMAVLFAIEGWLGWLSWRSPALPVGRLLLESTLVGFGVGFAEELFFRGWLFGGVGTGLRAANRPGDQCRRIRALAFRQAASGNLAVAARFFRFAAARLHLGLGATIGWGTFGASHRTARRICLGLLLGGCRQDCRLERSRALVADGHR